MKLTEYTKRARKSYVYNSYLTIVSDDVVDYDKITRTKMAERVIQAYKKHPELILQILNKEELKFLKKIPKDGYILQEHEKKLAGQVSSVFVLIPQYENWNQYNIPEELWDTVQMALTNIPWDEVEINDEINQFKLGLLKIYGALTIEMFMKLCNHYELDNDCETPYIKRFLYFKEMENDEFIILDEYYEIEEALLHNISTKRPKLQIRPIEYIMRIQEETFDFQNKEIKKFYDYVHTKESYWIDRTLQEFIMGCHLNDVTYFTQKIKNRYFYATRKEEYKRLLKLAEKAFLYMPSGSLGGVIPLLGNKQECDECKSCLSEKDVDLFYKVYFGILEYVNKKYRIFPGYKVYLQYSINPNIIYTLRTKLFDNKKLFDEFIKKNPFSFNKKEMDIIRGFKRGIMDRFLVIKHDLEYSILSNSKNVYAIKALRSTLNEALQGHALPVFVETVLLPFGNVIIYDGILSVEEISFRNTMDKAIREEMKTKELVKKL